MEYFTDSNCDFDPANRTLANGIVAGILIGLGDPADEEQAVGFLKYAIDLANDQINANQSIEITDLAT